eukprot:scaffold219653_cov33-Cyclotella_meneghiniana.AAC.1
MKYLLFISSLIVAGLTVAVAQVVDHGEETHGVKTLDSFPTPSLSHIATPGFTKVGMDKKKRPTPSSSYIAPPVFTDKNDKPAQEPLMRGSGSVASSVFTTESVDEAASCVWNYGFTFNCDYCCSGYCVWTVICFPSPGAQLHPATAQHKKGRRRPTPSSSYVASPVFTADS